MLEGSTPPWGSFHIKGPLTPPFYRVVTYGIIFEHRFQIFRGCLKCLAIVGYKSLRQSPSSNKPLQAPNECLCRHVQQYLGAQLLLQNRYALLVLLGPLVRIINGPAKSTPVKLKAGSSFTLLTGKEGGGGVANEAPSNLRQVTDWCMTA